MTGRGRLANVSRSTRRATSLDVVSAGIALEWHRPIGLRTQVDLSTSALGDLDGLDVERSWNNEAGLQYLLGERWFLSLHAAHEIDVLEDVDDIRSWRVDTTTLIRYHLEDRISLDAECRTSHRNFRRLGRGSIDSNWRNRETDFQLGMSYEVGRMSAPGLIQPVVPVN